MNAAHVQTMFLKAKILFKGGQPRQTDRRSYMVLLLLPSMWSM